MSNQVSSHLALQWRRGDVWFNLPGHANYDQREIQDAYAKLDRVTQDNPGVEYRLINVTVKVLANMQKEAA